MIIYQGVHVQLLFDLSTIRVTKFIVICLNFLINNHMYLAPKQESSMRILDMKIFNPIKGCKNGQMLVFYWAIRN